MSLKHASSVETGFTAFDSGSLPTLPLEVPGDLKLYNEKQDEKQDAASSLPEVPEGGLQAWLTVLGVWLMQICTFGYTNDYGVYHDFYVREYLGFKYTASQISWIGSVQLFLILSLGLVSGRGFDTGYFYALMIGGSALVILCLFMLSLTHAGQYYQVFLSQGLGFGIATGVTYVPGFAVMGHYFRKRRAVALGICASGSAIGAAIHPIMLNKLFHGNVGFHNGVRASAGFIAGILIISNLLTRTRLPPAPKKEGSTLDDFKEFLSDSAFVGVAAGTLLVIAGIYFPIFYLQLNAVSNGVDKQLAFYSLVIFNFLSAIGRVVPSFFVPRFGVFNVIIPGTLIAGALTFLTFSLKTGAAVVMFAIFYGFFTGWFVGLMAPMVTSLARKESEAGARLGVCFTFTGLGGLLGPPVAGALVGTGSGYTWWKPTLFSALCIFVGAGCFVMSRIIVGRRKNTWRC